MIYFDDITCYQCQQAIDPETRKKYVDIEEDTTLYFCDKYCLAAFENQQARHLSISQHRRCNWELVE